jgi:predicted kinase
MAQELVLFIGLQGAGKSSFYRTRFADTHDLVSKDLFRNNRNPACRQRQLIEEALGAGRSVVVDNTNPTPQDRAELVALARSFGAAVIGYYFESRLADCLERNRQRPGKARIPDVALYVTRKKLVPPTVTEGFDSLFYVRLLGDGLFEVVAWKEGMAEEETRGQGGV